MTNAVAIAQSGSNNVTFRNRIINGAMGIDQRNGGASVTPTGNTYTLDRWWATMSAASKFSIQQNAGAVTPPAGFTNYLGITSTSAYTVGATETFSIRQVLEGFNVADFGWGTANASTITLSFWVRSSLTGTFGGSLYNSAANRWYAFSYTVSVANTWEQKTLTIPGDTSGTWLANNGVGIGLVFSLGAGATLSGTPGAWSSTTTASATGAVSVVGTNGATFYITGVQLEKGTTATPFEFRQYGTEFALCQRYYQVYDSFRWDTYMSSGDDWFGSMAIQPMRTAPSASANLYSTSLGSTMSFSSSSYNRVILYATPTTSAGGNYYDVNTLKLSAEL